MTSTAPRLARSHIDLHDELHARPALPVRAPGVVSAWAQWGMSAEQADQALGLLAQALGQTTPAAGTRHQVVRGPQFELKFERHGEFVSWQVFKALDVDHLADTDIAEANALDVLPPEFVACLQAGVPMIAATHVVLLSADEEDLLRWRARMTGSGEAASASPLIGARIADSRAVVLTRLDLGDDGFTRFVVLDFGLAPDQAAREAQRLCEIEIYRMLAMLGFPAAQQASAALGELERGLQRSVDAMANEAQHDDALTFHALTRLAAEVEHAAARSRYRFAATRAYHQIVQSRLAELREQPLSGVQTLGGFLGRRFAPAMAFCDSTDRRLSDVADRIQRAVTLSQVRAEVQRENTNQELLRALAHRQQLQLRLQQTVEGLSVVAISYYALGLVGVLAKGATAWPGVPPVSPDLVVGVATIPVVLGVLWFVRRLRRDLGA